MSTRVTAQRREILSVLGVVQGFVSAQELHTLIVRNGGQIALATVYAQLKRLVASDEVDVVMTDRGEALYRRCVVDRHHHHLACRECGAAVEVDAPELEQWANEVGALHGYDDLHHVLELNGVCAACRATSR
ncbi:MAG: transcriptional repressor [Acidobacteriota bacterium]|nr:transcriptional repressor [Acidobacteriota bacterium]MDE3043857.1 transcriptional repressor [Acidobacteriota bacterium]MDE3106922.1 transcriptional repressor [Acidobacteriota bacterium]MDE3223038.1 transcriptional repressor [Acidobacteriota bacterium]MDE3223676.1 transcriptional repressor [Acidobacteriota bacterium]